MSIKGSCLCGGIEYEVNGEFGRVVNCHCSMCRKATGAAFRTRAAISPGAFRWLVGEELVSKYRSSPEETRTFCRSAAPRCPPSWPETLLRSGCRWVRSMAIRA